MIDFADRGILILDSESEYDLTTPNGKKAFRDAINAAAYYSDRLSTRSARGKKLRAMSGEPNSSVRAFGFEEDRVTVREDEAEVIREMTSRVLAGQTLMAVVGRLPGQPIVSEEEFDRVCALFAARRRGRPTRYLCAALAVCGAPDCSFPLYGRAQKAMKPYPEGSVRRHYWCVRSIGGCGRTSIDQWALDKAVSRLVIEILSDPRNTVAIETAAREIASESSRLDLAIAEAEDVAEALADRLGRGELKLNRYDAAIMPLDERIAKLKAEREALSGADSEPSARMPLEASREQWQRRWDAADDRQKRDLLKMGLRGRHLVIAPMERGAGGISPAESPAESKSSKGLS